MNNPNDPVPIERGRRKRRKKSSDKFLFYGLGGFVLLMCLIPIFKGLAPPVNKHVPVDLSEVANRSQPASPVEDINATTGGQTVDVLKYLKKGRTTVLYLHSDDCPPCNATIPIYERTAAVYPDIKFYMVDIDRPNSRGIDFDSPVANQFQANSIPFFIWYEGLSEVARGDGARDRLNQLMRDGDQ